MSSTLELDQDDMTARLTVDAVTGQVVVFSQRKGVTDNDIQTGLSALNQKNGLIGIVLIVLMPKLMPETANTPAPMYATRYTVQVIDWPALRQQSVGVSAESMAERVRQVLHFASFGRGQSLYFDGMDPIPLEDPKKISYAVHFRKQGADTPVAKCGAVTITPQTGANPQTVTLSVSTAGASIYYSTDGSYPSSVGAAATPPTSALYSAPFSVNAALTLRAAAEAANYQPGDPAQGVYT